MHDQTPTRCAIGVDVGGTKIAAGLVSLADGRVLARQMHPTRPERGGEAVLADVIALVKSLQESGRRIGASPASLGIGVCELVSPDGHMLSNATVRWMGIQVGATLHDAMRLPVKVDADVRAAARGEAHFGAGQGFDSFLYVTVGTGISASLVVKKMPYVGARGLTGTFASSRGLIPGDGGTLAAGPPLEQYAAGPALAARMAAVRKEFCGAAPDVLALAESGDTAARTIVASAGEALGAAIAQLVNVLDPAAVVIGGGLGLATGRYRESIDGALRAHAWSELHRDIPLVSAQLGNDAGIIGAALAAANL